MERYQEYKDSEIEWAKVIPSSWNTAPVWSVCSYNDESLRESTPADYVFDYYDVSSVHEGTIGDAETISFGDAPSRARRLVKESDVIVSTVRTYLKAIAQVNHELEGSVVSTGFVVLRPKDIDPDYFFYVLSSEGFVNEVVSHSTGVSYPAITPEALVKLRIPIPSKIEQSAISVFLNSRIAEIDALIEETEKSIELLEEYRKSAISEAVTKGLNPHVPLKDSGIEWIGEIPEHWDIKKFKYIASVRANLVDPREHSNLKQVSPERIEKDTGKLLECQTVFESGVESDNHLFKEGQLLYSKVRPALNKVTIAPFDGLCSADMYPIETNECPGWLLYAMLSQPFVVQVRVSTDRVKMPKVNKEELGAFWLPVPPVEEQEEIAEHLKSTLHSVEAAISKQKQLILSLQEYRKSLISEAVTSKFKVPEVH